MKMAGCELCENDGGDVLFCCPQYRVVSVDGIDGRQYPGFCRVIWNGHVREMTDLDPADRQRLMDAVFRVEAALRICLQPEKVNLASLGNMTPHLHWHVIPRRSGDPTFPQPIWAAGIAPSLQVDTLGSTPGTHNGVIALEWKSAVIEALNS